MTRHESPAESALEPDAVTAHIVHAPRRLGLGAVLLALGLVAAACGSDSTADAGSTSDAAASPAESEDEAMEDEAMEDDAMEDDAMEDDAMESMNDLMSTIVNRSDLSILDEAIHAADLQDTFHDDGPFTMFAPSDAAFEAYLGEMAMTAEELLGDVDALTALLQAHVVSGVEDSTMVMTLDGQTVTTLAGTDLAITVDGQTVMVGAATVVEYDVTADNGVIHIIDQVLVP